MSDYTRRQRVGRAVRGRSRGGCTTRIVIALAIVAFAFIQHRMSTREEVNPYTGETQRISLTPQEEVALGLQAAPQMARQHGGLHPSSEAQELVDRVGAKLVAEVEPMPVYRFEFHLLADNQMINAFALPGGQIFITAALFKKMAAEDELAGVLGHEVGHVIARHSAEQMAKAGLLSGVGMAAGTLIGGEMGGGQQVAAMVNQALSTKYGREDEYHSDEIGANLMQQAGYDPRAILKVMEVLKSAGGGGQPEMLSSHPYPDNRIERLKKVVLPKLIGQ